MKGRPGEQPPAALNVAHLQPSLTRSIADALVIKDDNVYFLCEPNGNVPMDGMHGLGLYYHDCRYLDGYALTFDGCALQPLAAEAREGFLARIALANPPVPGEPGIPGETVGVTWTRLVRGHEHTLYDVIAIENFGGMPMRARLELTFRAGFDDVFNVRVRNDVPLGRRLEPSGGGDRLTFLYEGADGCHRGLLVRFATPPAAFSGATARYELDLPVRGKIELLVALTATEGNVAAMASETPHAIPRPASVARWLARADGIWLSTRPTVRGSSILLERAIERSQRDLHMLVSHHQGERYTSAGVPWYAALFGRDSLVTGLQSLAFDPLLARDTLRLLGRHQGRRSDAWRDEEPGKILHELRVGELARIGAIPHTPYYGSIDATPLFLVLLAAHARWTGSLELFMELRGQAEAALAWLDGPGDTNGDGFLDYATRSGRGLVNQGWKDSNDAVVDARGALATPPIALVEAQAYAYRARMDAADLFERAGDRPRAVALRERAAGLRERMDAAFWLPEQRYMAMALQRGGRPVDAISSNPGHLLWAGAVDDARAADLVRRLMAPDMFSGWGIRTLASSEVAYNPIGYHTGSVWPHDNALIAEGFKRYGFDAEAVRLFDALFDAACHLPMLRLPELFTGYPRNGFASPVRYPVACHPQAWAAAALPAMLVTLLGLVPDGFARTLRIERPCLPKRIDWLEIRRIHVAGAVVGLRFERRRGGVSAEVIQREGDLTVIGAR